MFCFRYDHRAKYAVHRSGTKSLRAITRMAVPLAARSREALFDHSRRDARCPPNRPSTWRRHVCSILCCGPSMTAGPILQTAHVRVQSDSNSNFSDPEVIATALPCGSSWHCFDERRAASGGMTTEALWNKSVFGAPRTSGYRTSMGQDVS